MFEDAVIDQTVEETIEEQQVEDTSGEEPQIDDQQAQEPADKVDGRKFNPKWSGYLKEMKESALASGDTVRAGEISDMLTKLRDGYARFGAVNELAPKGVDEIRAWKTTLDAIGGAEKAAELMEAAANIEQIDGRIASGDYGVIAELPAEMQKGIQQMLPNFLDNLQESDEKAYAALVQPRFAASLAATGLGDHLKSLYGLLGDNEQAKALVKQQYDWYQNQVSGAGTLPNGTKTVDPQVQRLQTELSQRQEADNTAFIGGIQASTDKYMGESFTKNAEVYLKQLNLTEVQKSDLMESFNQKMASKLGGDPAFQKQLKAYNSLKNRSADTVNAFIQAKVDENAKSVIDGLVTARYGGMKKSKATTNPGSTTTSGGAVRVAQAPPREQWDMAKMDAMGYEATAKKGIYYLTGRKEPVQRVRQN